MIAAPRCTVSADRPLRTRTARHFDQIVYYTSAIAWLYRVSGTGWNWILLDYSFPDPRRRYAANVARETVTPPW
jgi:hypothetical protein